MRDLPTALERQDEIARRLEDQAPAVFLDYDGTLTPIVPDPASAILTDEMRQVIRDLARLCTVAVVSGRDLQDVRNLVAIDELVYAGSHGFDIVGAHGKNRDQRRGEPFLPALDRSEERLRRALADVKGAAVERKRFAIAVHYRAVADTDVPAVEAAVDDAAVAEEELRKTGGKKVFELRPNIDWDKGRALLWLMKSLGLDDGLTLPIFIGDDVTDEDALRAIRNTGIGIVVMGEEERDTLAHYVLRDTDEAGEFLRALAGLLEGRKS